MSEGTRKEFIKKAAFITRDTLEDAPTEVQLERWRNGVMTLITLGRYIITDYQAIEKELGEAQVRIETDGKIIAKRDQELEEAKEEEKNEIICAGELHAAAKMEENGLPKTHDMLLLRIGELAKAEQDNKQLREALIQAKKDQIKLANDAVEKLIELKPDFGWDDGDSTASYYYKQIDEALHPIKPSHEEQVAALADVIYKQRNKPEHTQEQ